MTALEILHYDISAKICVELYAAVGNFLEREGRKILKLKSLPPCSQPLNLTYKSSSNGQRDSLTFRSFSLFKAWFSASVLCTSSFFRMVVFLMTVRWPSPFIVDNSAAGGGGATAD